MAIKIFFCYSHEDEELVKKLKNHLQLLQHRNLIEMWCDRDISAGRQWAEEISRNLNSAHIILLMISSDFMASADYYSIEIRRALEHHHRGEARVIPIILRHCLWRETDFGKLLALPKDGKPVINWPDRDSAFLDIAEGIYTVIKELHHQSPASLPAAESPIFGLVKTLKHSKFLDTSIVSSVAFSPKRRILVSGGGDTRIKVWDLSNWQLQYSLSGTADHLLRISSASNVCVTIADDGLTLAGGGIDNHIRIWRLDRDAKQIRHTLVDHTNIVTSVAFSPEQQILASGSKDKTIKIWRSHIDHPLHTLQGHTDSVTSLAFSPDNQLLTSGSKDKTIKIWNPHLGQWLYTLTGHTGIVTSVAFSPDGQILASGSEDKAIKLWNPHTRQLLYTLKGHTNAVTSVTFSPDGPLLASGSEDKTIKIWNSHTGQFLYTLNEHADAVTSVAFSPDGHLLASAGCDSSVNVWRKL